MQKHFLSRLSGADCAVWMGLFAVFVRTEAARHCTTVWNECRGVQCKQLFPVVVVRRRHHSGSRRCASFDFSFCILGDLSAKSATQYTCLATVSSAVQKSLLRCFQLALGTYVMSQTMRPGYAYSNDCTNGLLWKGGVGSNIAGRIHAKL